MKNWNLALLGVTVVFGVGAAWWCYAFWPDILTDNEPLSQTVRNLAFVIGGVVALLMALWRGIIATRQEQTSRLTLNNERYQRGVELLAHDSVVVRSGGLLVLVRLAKEDATYSDAVIDVFRQLLKQRGLTQEEMSLVPQHMAILQGRPLDDVG
ncbi:MAG: hypothetical protein OXM01_01765 [Gemmatimonadota bacterium]|nr:hypothetical protein [Gemmatimonadota bacterium]